MRIAPIIACPCSFFAYYETEQEAKLDMKPRGAARVVSAVLRPTAKMPHLFSFFSDDGKDFQLYVQRHLLPPEPPPSVLSLPQVALTRPPWL